MASEHGAIVGNLGAKSQPHECWQPHLKALFEEDRYAEGDVWRCDECGQAWVAHRGGENWVGRVCSEALQWLLPTRRERRAIKRLRAVTEGQEDQHGG